MSLSSESGEVIVMTRAEILYGIIKKVAEKDVYITLGSLARMVREWVKENDVYSLDKWLIGRSISFLTSPAWLKKHTPELEIMAARDGYAFMVQPFKGAKLTRRKKEIRNCMGERERHILAKMERHNYISETLTLNPRYKGLQLSFFNDTLLPASIDD